jgi:type II restriction enzyme
MNLSMTGASGVDFKTGTHRARVLVESWGEHHLYCPNCTSPILTQQDDADGGLDCPRCSSQFRLKGQRTRIGHSVTDGPYSTLTRAIRRSKAPGYFIMHYDAASLSVRDLVLVPGGALTPEAIVRGPDGVGCRIVLDSLPAAARIPIITTIKSSGAGDTECIMISRPEEVREKFRQFKK